MIWDSDIRVKHRGERYCRREDTGIALRVVFGDNYNYMCGEAVAGQNLHVPI
jgi:hypothetical protein